MASRAIYERLPKPMDTTARAWNQFVATGFCDESAVRSAILASWHRCTLAGCSAQAVVAPRIVSREALERASADCGVFLQATRVWASENLKLISETGLMLSALSPSLWVLDLFGEAGTLKRLERFGFRKGVSWTEHDMGTNAFALAALEHLPVQVSGAEHYRQALHPLSVAAAPVWDSQGHLRGVIGLCGSASQNHPHTLALIVTIGQLVQEYLADHAGPSPLLRNERGTPPHLLRGMMLVNRDGEVTHLDSEGCRLLDMEQGELVGTALRRWIVAPEGLVRSLQAGQTMREIEVRFRTLNGILTLLMTCEPVAGPDGELRGSSCTFMPMDRVTRLVTRFSGALARINFNDILGNSRLIQATVERARQAARGQEPILLIGEAGSGKLLFAQAIHAASIRRDGPFVNFDCGAFSCFSPDFLLVDLMGTAPSPEDGACRGQPSKFELAADGTLFLDRVESLTPRAQRTLLSVLSSRRVWRVGSQRAELLRARIIAASDTNLHQEVEEGRFLGELLAQFTGNIITVPPLRERREDIGPLVERFVFEFGRQLDKELVVCQPALDALVRYAWPGNITELRSVLGRAAQLAQEGIIELHHLPARIQQQIDPRLPLAHGERPMSIEEAERYAIIQAGWAMSGNVQQMANALGIGRTTLWRKLKALQLSPDHFRRAPEA